METYFDKLPIYLAEELLLASHSYELISRHRELIDDDLKEFVDEMKRDDHDVSYLLLKAIEYGLYDIIEYLSDEYSDREYYSFDRDIIFAAAKNGDYYTVIQLMNNLPYMKKDLFVRLAREGHFSLIDRLIDERYLDDNYTLYGTASKAAEMGDEEFIESIIDAERFSEIYDIMGHRQSKAKIYGSLIESIALGFARGGHLESLKWAMSLGLNDEILEYIFTAALANGRREIVNYLIDNGMIVSINDIAFKSVVERGDIELFKYLMTLGQFDVNSIMEFAVLAGKIDITRYLLSIGADRENAAEALEEYIDSAYDVGMSDEEIIPYKELLEELTN